MADTVIILNDKAVIAALNRAPDVLIAAIQPAVERWQLRRQAELARYPPQNPASRYRRTGTLGRKWTGSRPTWSASRSGFESRLGNNTPYAPFVQGERQSRYNGAWLTVQDAEDKGKPALEADVRAAAEQAAQQINGVTK